METSSLYEGLSTGGLNSRGAVGISAPLVKVSNNVTPGTWDEAVVRPTRLEVAKGAGKGRSLERSSVTFEGAGKWMGDPLLVGVGEVAALLVCEGRGGELKISPGLRGKVVESTIL